MLYYYIEPYNEELETYEYGYGSIKRNGRLCEFEDYPEHKHRTFGFVQFMELIPEKRYVNTKYLNHSRIYFNKIELEKDAVIKVNDRYYMREFEEKHNTSIWQEWKLRNYRRIKLDTAKKIYSSGKKEGEK